MSYQTVSEGDGPDYEIHTCDRCGRTTILAGVGGDVACCPCEFENEGVDVPPMTERERQEADVQQERFEMEQEYIEMWDGDSDE